MALTQKRTYVILIAVIMVVFVMQLTWVHEAEEESEVLRLLEGHATRYNPAVVERPVDPLRSPVIVSPNPHKDPNPEQSYTADDIPSLPSRIEDNVSFERYVLEDYPLDPNDLVPLTPHEHVVPLPIPPNAEKKTLTKIDQNDYEWLERKNMPKHDYRWQKRMGCIPLYIFESFYEAATRVNPLATESRLFDADNTVSLDMHDARWTLISETHVNMTMDSVRDLLDTYGWTGVAIIGTLYSTCVDKVYYDRLLLLGEYLYAIWRETHEIRDIVEFSLLLPGISEPFYYGALWAYMDELFEKEHLSAEEAKRQTIDYWCSFQRAGAANINPYYVCLTGIGIALGRQFDSYIEPLEICKDDDYIIAYHCVEGVFDQHFYQLGDSINDVYPVDSWTPCDTVEYSEGCFMYKLNTWKWRRDTLRTNLKKDCDFIGEKSRTLQCIYAGAKNHPQWYLLETCTWTLPWISLHDDGPEALWQKEKFEVCTLGAIEKVRYSSNFKSNFETCLEWSKSFNIDDLCTRSNTESVEYVYSLIHKYDQDPPPTERVPIPFHELHHNTVFVSNVH